MSHMIAESEALPRPTHRRWTSHQPTSEFSLAGTQKEWLKQEGDLIGSWSTAEPIEAADDVQFFLNDFADSKEPRKELVHCCEEISEQLLQIRDELQTEGSAADIVQLRVFGD